MDTGSESICHYTSSLCINSPSFNKQDEIAQDPGNVDTTFCPVILGSDKTTVLVAMGQNEYYPLYLSNGLVHNTTRRAQRNAVSLVAFLVVPKSMCPKY